MALQTWRFTVTPEDASLRLDQLVAQRTGLSRREAREALKLGGVQAGKKRVRVAGRLLAPGTEVRVSVDDSLGAVPDREIPVIYEDPWLLVVSKPGGIPTQGTLASDRHDLLAMLTRQRPDQTLWLQHRLDTGTSGLLILAKAREADLGRAFAEREVAKTYLARTCGSVPEATVERPFGRIRLSKPPRFGCPGSRLGERLHADRSEGLCTEEDLLEVKPSATAIRPASPAEVEGLAPGTWAVAEPHTGRTHQIRVHLALLGCPVLGDSLYGGEASSQLWLHAWKLSLKHPVTGELLELVADPERFRIQP